MTTWQPKMHAPDMAARERGHSWALCGHFGDTPMTDNLDDVTCGHCLRKLGRRRPNQAEHDLVAAVRSWHADYTARAVSNRDAVLCRAVDTYEQAVKTRN